MKQCKTCDKRWFNVKNGKHCRNYCTDFIEHQRQWREMRKAQRLEDMLDFIDKKGAGQR